MAHTHPLPGEKQQAIAPPHPSPVFRRGHIHSPSSAAPIHSTHPQPYAHTIHASPCTRALLQAGVAGVSRQDHSLSPPTPASRRGCARSRSRRRCGCATRASALASTLGRPSPPPPGLLNLLLYYFTPLHYSSLLYYYYTLLYSTTILHPSIPLHSFPPALPHQGAPHQDRRRARLPGGLGAAQGLQLVDHLLDCGCSCRRRAPVRV